MEYYRRRTKDRDLRRRNFKRSLTLVLLTPVVVYVLARTAAWAVNEWLLAWMFRQFGSSGPSTVIDGKTAELLGLTLAGCATLRMATDLWGSKRTTESWHKGYEGEEMTGQVLDRLPKSYAVLHDLRMPGTRANIDHVVIGPTGVFTIETKHYSSDVTIHGETARHSGRSMDAVVDQANRQAEAVRSALSSSVRAVVCVQGAAVTKQGWFSKPVVDGVRFCSGDRLLEVITRLDVQLDDAEVERLRETAERKLSDSLTARPAATSDGRLCECGSTLVLRHRRADGAPFLGCSRFPACRHVVPVGARR